MNICYNQNHQKKGLLFNNKNNFYNILGFDGSLISYSKEHFYKLQNYIKSENLSYEYLIYLFIRVKYYQNYFFTKHLGELEKILIQKSESFFKLPTVIINTIFDFLIYQAEY